ncbi:MAG: DUF2062 domain-containing protein [Rhodospirillaceae bacterium]|jgi:uncharacterized protein|nr:DUF2062 domain-containing protein [Rhodospirillaceae bacterium]
MTRLKRNMRYRLVIPIQRSVHPPEHTARGVAVGLAWGLTPTVGVQMIFVFICWVVARRFIRRDFSLIIALAWTWTTNVITLFPCYYLFYMTGQVMLGRFDDLSGYGEFMKLWDSNVAAESGMGYWEWLWTYTVVLIKGWGLPMLIGCLPWSALGSWAGYVWSLRFVRRYRTNRSRRRAEKGDARAATLDSRG